MFFKFYDMHDKTLIISLPNKHCLNLFKFWRITSSIPPHVFFSILRRRLLALHPKLQSNFFRNI